MKKIACKTICREIDELERGHEPGAVTRAHLETCDSCRDFYSGRLQLQQMIGGLESVKAPGDFDFRLRARLANERGKPAPMFSPKLFGLPSIALALIAIMIGVGLFIRSATDSEKQSSTVAQSQTQQVAERNPAPNNIVPEDPQLTGSDSGETRQAANATEPTTAVKDRSRNRKASKRTSSLRDDFLARSESAAVFPLEAAEPLRVSVDYATGGSKTISLPAVSFGSQQVVAQGASMMKTSSRTVW